MERWMLRRRCRCGRKGDRGLKYRPARLEESADVIREKKNGGAWSRPCTGGRSQVWRGRVSGERGSAQDKSVQRRSNAPGLFLVQVRSAGNRKSRLRLHCLLFAWTICTQRQTGLDYLLEVRATQSCSCPMFLSLIHLDVFILEEREKLNMDQLFICTYTTR